ncbi:MAG TPA: MOSC N-terminal beta barrel domain-containing protein [Candidatus Polarisedimenticolaceae bacterium]|nr:MOSC N-terminal beta barrel domain-containing protein [Candidatus Polarisedimenticolaceae bacterium]
MIPLGRVSSLARYPVKSMAGIATEEAELGWHGLQGDRRHAFRRVGNESGFPWLTASHLPELLLYEPEGEPVPTHVRTPAGRRLELGSAELPREIGERCGSGLELMQLRHGIFDDGAVSVIALNTIAAIGREAGMDLDRRRFRANVFLDIGEAPPFVEDGWVGGTLLFGEEEDAPAVSVTTRDERCVMVNLDPDTARPDARVMKAVVRLNGNRAGVYGVVVRPGTLRVGQAVRLLPRWPSPAP